MTFCSCRNPNPEQVEGRTVCATCGEPVPSREAKALVRRVVSHEKRIARLEAQLAELEAALERAARSRPTRGERRELIAATLRANPDRADREIARSVGCSPSTVGAVRRAVGVSKSNGDGS